MRALLVCFALAACSSDGNKNPDGDDTPVDGNPNSDPVTPQTGAWNYSEVTPVSSTCTRSVSNGTGGFAIDQASSSSFHIVPGDGTAPFTCTLSGKSFDCPERLAAMEDLRPAVDALVSVRATANGAFSDATHATGRQEANVTCTGAGCGALGFPCKNVVDFVIRAR